MTKANNDIKEFHLFAGIGGGIYGGELLGHKCCAGVEIDEFCKKILLQRQADGWMPKFPIFDDVTKIDGSKYKGTFDILCGGFPCQAFSYAAHGNNIEAKNLWGSPAKVCGLCIDSCKSKQEEFSINDAPKLCSELLDLCIEGFCSSIG